MKAETRLLSSLFGRCLTDEHLTQEIDGVNLTDTIDSALNTLASAKHAPSFATKAKRVLELRFGFGDNRCHTLAEVGRELNLGRGRIRQLK